ncbi:MAG: Uma2 family endonuclease [Acidobacteriota bacterium]
MSAETKHRYTLEEYLALERESDARHEFWDGEIFAMSGGTLAHERILGNVRSMLRNDLRHIKFDVFGTNMQIKVPSAPPYRYADGSVVCGQVEVERFNGNDLLLNPVLIYEVLSPSTEAYDRGDKFTYYKSIATLKEYLLIAQHRPHITHFVKQDDGSWSYSETNALDASIHLPSVGATFNLSDVYQDVEFDQSESSAKLLSRVD